MDLKHEEYYVPAQSKFPLFASITLFMTVFGLGNWLNEIKSGSEGSGMTLFIFGLILFCFVLFQWFSTVVDENIRGMNSVQLKRSYVWGMGWFIFSEVMFFAAFFGALFYIRQIALPELSLEDTSNILWGGFQEQWPLMTTPDQALRGAAATVTGPGQNMSFPGWNLEELVKWLPLWNTTVLLASSVTVHIAHTALLNDNKKKFNWFLGITVVMGIFFLFLQAEEYIHAYHVGLQIDSGVYGTTFFLLTGFHGLHVTLGTFMLLVQWLRSVTKGHFTHKDCYGFEASSWYWHFVDVVWLGLFIFVYILG